MLGGRKMNELETKVLKYYQDFKRDFTEENFPQVFDLIESYNKSPNWIHHKLGSFVIFYTPIRYKPKLMIIGNNPSWFDKDDPEKGYEIVKGLMSALKNLTSLTKKRTSHGFFRAPTHFSIILDQLSFHNMCNHRLIHAL